MAPTGAPPPSSIGVQNSSPAIAAGRPSTRSGTDQSKTFVRTSGSVTCGGSLRAIQWIRWSCHSKRPERSTTFQRGGAFGSTPSGTSAP